MRKSGYSLLQKQPFEDVLQNRCSSEFCNIYRKTSVLNQNAFNFIKQRLQNRCFPMNIAKFLRTAVSVEHLWWLLLLLSDIHCSDVNKPLQKAFKCVCIVYTYLNRMMLTINTTNICSKISKI